MFSGVIKRPVAWNELTAIYWRGKTPHSWVFYVVSTCFVNKAKHIVIAQLLDISQDVNTYSK